MLNNAPVYILWLIFGIFGAHHFYLRRYRHGFVWLCSFGGFILGWMRDITMLDKYIKEASEDATYRTELLRRLHSRPRPKSSWTRLIGEVVMGLLFAVIYRGAIPEEYLEEGTDDFMNLLMKLLVLGTPVAIATGIHLVGNIGHHSMAFPPVVISAGAISLLLSPESDYLIYNVLFVTLVANKYCKQWCLPPGFEDHELGDQLHQEQQHRSGRTANNHPIRQGTNGAGPRPRPCKPTVSRKKAVAIVSVCFFFYCALWFSGLWFNTYITTSDRERVRVREAVTHFFNSPAWKKMLTTLWDLYDFWRIHGTHRLYQEFIKALDPEGEDNAYKVLDILPGASDTEIRNRCRTLIRKHHPDKELNPDLKSEAQARFIEVQEACQIVKKVRARRSRKSQSDEL